MNLRGATRARVNSDTGKALSGATTPAELTSQADELAEVATELCGAASASRPEAMAVVASNLAVLAELRALRLTLDPLTKPVYWTASGEAPQ